MSKRKTLEEFIKESKKYIEHKFLDYSKFDYIQNKTDGCIICRKLDKDGNEHGEFWQSPNKHNHKKHKGKCPKCIIEERNFKKSQIKIIKCSKCGNDKRIGIKCEHCKKEYHKVYAINHKKEALEYRTKNKEILNEKRRENYANNKNNIKIKTKSNNKKYRENNPDKITQNQRNYFNNVLKHDPIYKLEKTLKRRILLAVKLQKTEKAYKSIELIGCSIDFLLNHLQQSAIKNGYIDFDILNYSGKDYHIDHIKPISSFDLTRPEEQKKCFHWSNLQILTAKENIIKNDKII